MELGELPALRQLSIQPGSVYHLRMYPEDGVVPKNEGDTYRDKFSVIVGKNADGSYLALTLINTEINHLLKNKIGKYQFLIKHDKYDFLHGKDRYVDCYRIKEIQMRRILEHGTYIGIISDTDMQKIVSLLQQSPLMSPAKLQRYSITNTSHE